MPILKCFKLTKFFRFITRRSLKKNKQIDELHLIIRELRTSIENVQRLHEDNFGDLLDNTKEIRTSVEIVQKLYMNQFVELLDSTNDIRTSVKDVKNDVEDMKNDVEEVKFDVGNIHTNSENTAFSIGEVSDKLSDALPSLYESETRIKNIEDQCIDIFEFISEKYLIQ